MKPLLFFYQEPQRFLRAAMVINVSPNWVSVAATRFSSSSVSRHARALAKAVMEAVHSHAFKKLTSGPRYAMDEKRCAFGAGWPYGIHGQLPLCIAHRQEHLFYARDLLFLQLLLQPRKGFPHKGACAATCLSR